MAGRLAHHAAGAGTGAGPRQRLRRRHGAAAGRAPGRRLVSMAAQARRRCRRWCWAIPAPPANGGCAATEIAGRCRRFSGIRSAPNVTTMRALCERVIGTLKTQGEVDGTAQGQDSDGGRRRLDRAGLGQWQGDRGDLCARGRAGVLRRPQRRPRRRNRQYHHLAKAARRQRSPPTSPAPPRSRRWSRPA